MHDPGKKTIAMDIRNLVSRLRKQRNAGTTVHSRTLAVINEFAVGDNVVRAFGDSKEKVVKCITFATAQMRKNFKSFPQVIEMDATFGVNRQLYKLFSFMIKDSHGHGQFVQHALIDSESAKNMTNCMLAFKEANPEWEASLKVILVRLHHGEHHEMVRTLCVSVIVNLCCGLWFVRCHD